MGDVFIVAVVDVQVIGNKSDTYFDRLQADYSEGYGCNLE